MLPGLVHVHLQVRVVGALHGSWAVALYGSRPVRVDALRFWQEVRCRRGAVHGSCSKPYGDVSPCTASGSVRRSQMLYVACRMAGKVPHSNSPAFAACVFYLAALLAILQRQPSLAGARCAGMSAGAAGALGGAGAGAGGAGARALHAVRICDL